jgi:hypothetical protein
MARPVGVEVTVIEDIEFDADAEVVVPGSIS